jgi:type VI secretion system protein ImpF
MSTRELEPTVRPSVLDRLMNLEPGLAADPVITWRESVARLRNSLMRDIEWLLNTRRIWKAAPSQFTELNASVYHFGLPDITSHSRDAPETRQLLMRQIEECIRIFEPRLTSVQVTLPETKEGPHHRIRFMIDALMKMDPNPERVTFDTVLDVGSGEFHVAGDAHA